MNSKSKTRRVNQERREIEKEMVLNDRRERVERRQHGRRSAERIQKKMTMRFCFISQNIPAKWDMIFLEDIGAGGVCFRLNQKSDPQVEVGSIVRMKISFPGDMNPLECEGKVIRIQKITGTALNEIVARFVDLDSKSKNYIMEAVSRMARAE